MWVEVSGRVSGDNVNAVANLLRVISELQGAITQIDVTAGHLLVLSVPK
jgi:hypothetical protein